MSATTPEGKVKNKIKKVLDKYKNDGIYVYMPVPHGFGAQTLDYLGYFRGQGFVIEAKRPGGKPTDRQLGTIAVLRRAGVQVFIIDGDAGVDELDEWFRTVIALAAFRQAAA